MYMNASYREENLALLWEAVLKLKTPEECAKFFDDLCTKPELMAMSQRLEVASMLRKKKIYSDIVTATGASTATISRVNRSLLYGNEGYNLILDRLEGKK